MSNNASDDRGLRLTLRTLLAYMDDTLPPSEARQLGQMIAETPRAQELVTRIKKVTRRRRLTVPTGSGPEASDPNVVAAYLDNELSKEEVTEYEKLCLASDVNLAEVASCHEILSMIGQKAKVPREARMRMYRLVRGREALGRASREPAEATPTHDVSAIEPWRTEMPPRRRSTWDKIGLPLGVLALIILMAASAWMLTPNRADRQGHAPRIAQAQPEAPLAPVDAAAIPPKAEMEAAPQPEAPPDEDTAKDEAAAKKEATAAEAAKPAPGGVGTLETKDGVVLRYVEDSHAWKKLSDGATLAPNEKIVVLEPFRPAVVQGDLRAQVVGPAIFQPLAPAAGENLRIALERGRLVITSGTGGGNVGVVLGSKTWTVALTGESRVGLSAKWEPPGTRRTTVAPELTVYAVRGDVSLSSGDVKEDLKGPAVLEIGARGPEPKRADEAPPSWAVDDTPNAADEASGKALASYFTSDLTPKNALASAIEDEMAVVHNLAISALCLIDDIELVIKETYLDDEPARRREAIAALRDYRERGPEKVKALEDKLAAVRNDADWAKRVARLLEPLTPDEATAEDRAQLVDLLADKDVAVRELALWKLKTLTRRDDMDYDPDRPAGKGLQAWRDLVRKGEAAAPPAPEAAEEPE